MKVQIYFSNLIKAEEEVNQENYSKEDVRKYVFSNTNVDKWNCLPDQCINTNTVNSFKSYILSYIKAYWNRKLEIFNYVVIYSRLYMAKACAY